MFGCKGRCRQGLPDFVAVATIAFSFPTIQVMEPAVTMVVVAAVVELTMLFMSQFEP